MLRFDVEVEVRIPHEWLKEIDEKVKKFQYASRSAFIRKAIYELLEREKGEILV